MNRLVLIGNGFDLAHGLKTSYADFINWYWEQWGERLAKSGNMTESDGLCSFTLNKEIGLGGWYLVPGYYYRDINLDFTTFVRRAMKDKKLCEFHINSPLLELINKNIETKGWVDIEHDYYSLLVGEKKFGPYSYKGLNEQLEIISNKLIEYLSSVSRLTSIEVNEEIVEKIYGPISNFEIAVANQKLIRVKEELDLEESQIMLLNFNYTSTPELYMKEHDNVVIHYIHGHLAFQKSVIFGYGDELDKEFPRLKEEYDNECLRHAKSINYLDSNDYHLMLEFIESEPFQVVIMGHSCGTSDRTLLNTIFEHPNCVSIKPYYYINKEGKDNYQELVQNIYRNFTDMKLMRDRVVSKRFTEPLTTPKQENPE